MSIRGYYLVCLILLLSFAAGAQAYEVVLKNGKVVKGTLVSEDDALIVIQDADGLRINIKKPNVDAEKTQTANPPAEPAPSVEPAKPAQAAPAKTQQKQTPSKPAKKITEEDLEKLREKYDLGEGTFSQEAHNNSATDGEEKDDFSQASESEWQAQSERHRDRVKGAEQRYTSLAQECEELKKIAVQTHILVDQDGKELEMTETREKVCEMADSAQAQLEQDRSDLNEFLTEAKEKAVPPGWLRNEEGKDPDQ